VRRAQGSVVGLRRQGAVCVAAAAIRGRYGWVKSEGVVVQKEPASLCVAQATLQWLFTGAIPLLTGTGALTCSVSDLGRFTPP